MAIDNRNDYLFLRMKMDNLKKFLHGTFTRGDLGNVSYPWQKLIKGKAVNIIT